jgi:hypothetical protein
MGTTPGQPGIPKSNLSSKRKIDTADCFGWCASFSSVTFESGSKLSHIENRAFRGTGLTEIVIPASVEVVGEACFEKCRSLSSVTFESGSKLTRIEKQAFRGSGLIEIVIPGSVEFLGDECFRGCIRLNSVTFEPDSRLREFGKKVFFQVPASPTLPIQKCSVF